MGKPQTIAGKELLLLNLPFYLISRIDIYINRMFEETGK